MEIKIEKGIPIPKKFNTWSLLGQMNVGDSVFFPVAAEVVARALTSSMHYYSVKTGCKLTRRTVTENGVKGARIWRFL